MIICLCSYHTNSNMNYDEEYKLIERINSDYLKTINSKEYSIGKRVLKLKDALLGHKIKLIKQYIKNYHVQKKAAAFNIKSQLSIQSRVEDKISNHDKCAIYTCITKNYESVKEPLCKN